MMYLPASEGQIIEAPGYATLFNTPVCVAWDRCEQFLPGAFAATLRNRSAPVRVTVNHCEGHSFDVPGLALWEDARGLAFAFAIPATWHGHALARYMAEGTAGASITFYNLSARRNGDLHSIELASLHELCITARPALLTSAWLSNHVASGLPIEAARLWRSWTAGRALRDADVKALRAAAQGAYDAQGAQAARCWPGQGNPARRRFARRYCVPSAARARSDWVGAVPAWHRARTRAVRRTARGHATGSSIGAAPLLAVNCRDRLGRRWKRRAAFATAKAWQRQVERRSGGGGGSNLYRPAPSRPVWQAKTRDRVIRKTFFGRV